MKKKKKFYFNSIDSFFINIS